MDSFRIGRGVALKSTFGLIIISYSDTLNRPVSTDLWRVVGSSIRKSSDLPTDSAEDLLFCRIYCKSYDENGRDLRRQYGHLQIFIRPQFGHPIRCQSGRQHVNGGCLLALEFGKRPALMACLDFIEAAFIRIFDGEEQNVVRPTQREGIVEFRRRCLRNLSGGQNVRHCLTFLCQFQLVRHRLTNSALVFHEELAHQLEVGRRETCPKLLRKLCRKLFQQFSAVFRPFLALLLVFDNTPSDLEVGHHLERIDGGCSGTTGGYDQLPYFGKQGSYTVALPLYVGGGLITFYSSFSPHHSSFPINPNPAGCPATAATLYRI